MNGCSEVIKKLYDMRLVCAVYGDDEAIQTINDVIALLKEQEPRVMTLDEVYDLHRGDCVFVEIRNGIERNALMLYACENYYVDFRSTDYKTISKDTSLYQKQWRCWTSRPTEEQRKAAKWDA